MEDSTLFYLQTVEIKFKDDCKLICKWRNVGELIVLQDWSAS